MGRAFEGDEGCWLAEGGEVFFLGAGLRGFCTAMASLGLW